MKTKNIVIGLVVCFLITAFLGHFWKTFVLANHINDYHIGQYLDGGIFLLTTYFISHLFVKSRMTLNNTLIIVAIGISFCALYGDIYKTIGSISMGIILSLSQYGKFGK